MNENEKFFLCIKNWLTVFLSKQRYSSPNTIKAYKITLNLLRIPAYRKGTSIKENYFSNIHP